MRLRTKLVIAITLMVVAIVVTLSTIYVAQTVHLVVNQAWSQSDQAAHQVIHLARLALETDINSTRIDPNNPQEVNDWVEESLQTDPGVNGEIESLIGFSPIISDASVVGSDGRAIVHSNPEMVGKLVPTRPNLLDLANAKFWHQIKMVYGPIQTYVVKISLERDQRPFGSVQVGVSTVFLKTTLQKPLSRALSSIKPFSLVVLPLLPHGRNIAIRLKVTD